MDRQEIFTAVQDCIAESLAISKQEIRPESRLIDDLGADSLDFLDMIFSLEKRFSTRLRDPKLDLLVRADFSQAQTTQNGHLSAESIEKLSEWLPELKDATEVMMRDVYSYITVNTLVRLVEEKLINAETKGRRE
ncbi:phosphopantetheine-binding protein [bacterium]|nr:phosphopantetheine-binding protein [bacterium]MCI0602558.1 phosphopantetheine-binding protein [bacterium]